MQLKRFILYIVVTTVVLACGFSNAAEGPGMIVTLTSLTEGRAIHMKSTHLPNGKSFGEWGAFGGGRSSNWRSSGRTMGAAGDNRELPEWIDFEWQEIVYPTKDQKDFATYKELSDYVMNLYKTAPVMRARVAVRDRIPQDAIQSVIQSRKNRSEGESETRLWVYFVWTDAGVKFHWRLKKDNAPKELRSGGDDINSM